MGFQQRLWLVVLGAGALALGMFVVITARELDIHLLGVVCVLGGLAMVIVALPTNHK